MSADDNAPEQAREVEVVARKLCPRPGCLSPRALAGEAPCPWCVEKSKVILAALAPIRAVERQEAARAAWDDGYFHGWDDESFEERGKTPNPYRADGVTGRSGT